MHAVLDELGKTPLPHHQALEVLSAKALAARDYLTAFKLADRRCRIDPAPLAHCYVLRADASFNLGDADAARADLNDALRIAPEDLAALRRLFAWGSPEERRSAAMSLIKSETDIRSLRAAVELLFKAGQRRHASVSVFDRLIKGWVAWDADEQVELSIASTDQLITSVVAADPFHALATEEIKAAYFELARPASASPQRVSLAIDGCSFFSKRIAPNLVAVDVPPSRPSAVLRNEEAKPAVIIPVYDDVAATTACLESLLNDPDCGRDYRIVLIDDMSPDEAITRHLQTLSRLPFVELIVNEANLGFVGSINRALEFVPHGDVLLLNADTIVPPGFVGRLRQAARGSSGIGTVVPLSNNSSISDFPIPHQANPLGSYEDVIELDLLAQRANRDLVVDLPSGTGFCLYITRACIDAVGHLAETFERGYLEDIDFCLRAREQGFRNVCAPSIYVGHAGSRSFGQAKRELVLKNLAVLDHRFPRFRAETSGFVKADPLRLARSNIEHLRPTSTPEQRTEQMSKVSLPTIRKIDGMRTEPGDALAVIPARPSAAEFALLRGLAGAFFRTRPQLDIIVAGKTIDDARLMSHPNVFISGPFEPHELGRVLSTIRTSRILVLGLECADAPHPALDLAHATGLPVGYVDWSGGTVAVRSGDLAILPGMPRAWMVEQISAWVKGA
jgi:O-antigen biosynthesis protein